MLILMVLTGLLCCGIVAAACSENSPVTKIIVFAFTGWFFSHILVSGLLFWADAYSVNRCAFGCMIWWGFAAIGCLIRRKKLSVSFHLKNEIPVFIIVLLTVPLVLSKNEFFGMGQDQGVYQTQAILFMNGYTDVSIDLEEWYATEDPDEIARYEEATSASSLTGFYRYLDRSELSGIQSKNSTSENEGVLHGIPTFAALLALWGSLFGMANMQGINTVIYICVIFILFYICENLSVGLMGKVTAMGIYAISPVVIWTNKSALTETVFTLIFICYLYCILRLRDTEKQMQYALGSAFCIVTLSFFHVSVFVFMPLFVLVYLGLWYFCRERACLGAMILSTLGYLAGFWMMYTVATQYTADNYKVIYYGFIGYSTICQVVTAVCVAVVLLGLLLLLIRKPLPLLRLPASGTSFFVKLLCVVMACLALYRCYLKSERMIRQLPNVTLGAFLIVCGIVVPLIVYLSVFFATRGWLETFERVILLVFFTYCILFYSALFRPWTTHYYYYARYLTMFVPLLALMGGILLDKAARWQGILAVAVSVLILLPYDWCLATQKDDTRIEWSVLTELAAEIDSDDSVIIADDTLFRWFYFTLKAMTGADIYPAYDEEDLTDQLSSLEETDGDVFVLVRKSDTELAEDAGLVQVITLVSNASEDKNANLDDYWNVNHSKLLQLPFTFNQTKRTVVLYQAE